MDDNFVCFPSDILIQNEIILRWILWTTGYFPTSPYTIQFGVFLFSPSTLLITQCNKIKSTFGPRNLLTDSESFCIADSESAVRFASCSRQFRGIRESAIFSRLFAIFTKLNRRKQIVAIWNIKMKIWIITMI